MKIKYKNVLDEAKAVITQKTIVLNIYIRKEDLKSIILVPF